MSQAIAKHSRLPRKFTPSSEGTAPAKPTTGTSLAALEKRELILAETKTLLMQGSSIKEIAGQKGVSERTLQLWIHGTEDEELRKAWVDSMLVESGELLDNITETDINAHLKLAKAREILKKAQWYAEKRDRARYGEDKNPLVTVAPVLIIQTNAEPHQVIEAQAVSLPKEKA